MWKTLRSNHIIQLDSQRRNGSNRLEPIERLWLCLSGRVCVAVKRSEFEFGAHSFNKRSFICAVHSIVAFEYNYNDQLCIVKSKE